MKYHVICSQGRVGDKKNTTLKGAKLTAELLEIKFGVKAKYIGQYSEAKNDTWKDCLPEASLTLDSLQNEIQNNLEETGTNILALNTCSASLATLPAVVAKFPNIKILWVDAHADFNTPDTSETGYLGGMVLGAVCGLWESGYGSNVSPKQVALIGAHDIDSAEKNILDNNNILVISPHSVSPTKMAEIVGDSDVWIHIDWDVLEPGQINADYKVNGGLDLAQLVNSLSIIPYDKIRGLELAEFSATEDIAANSKSLENILFVVDSLLKK